MHYNTSLTPIAALSDFIVPGITTTLSLSQYSKGPLPSGQSPRNKSKLQQKALRPNQPSKYKSNPLTSQSNSNAPIQFSSNLVDALQTNTEVRLRAQLTHPNTLATQTPIALRTRPQLLI